MDKDKKILNYLGLCKKARCLVMGADTVSNSMSKISLIFVASDASDNTISKFINKCFYYKIPLNKDYTSLVLSKAIGKDGVKVLGVIDKNIANAILKLLKEENYES